jgi:vacuolar-type H+-ATPase subunit C/Vma6
VIEYGNVRVAAMRSRLLGRVALARLAEAGSAAALVGALEREPDWGPILRAVAALGSDPVAQLDAAIERHRSARLGALATFYTPPIRDLVAALVVPLDLERIVALTRRRRAGAGPDELGATIVGGAILDQAELGRLVRAPDLDRLAIELVRIGLIAPDDLAELRAASAPGEPPERWETALREAIEHRRDAWAAGRGAAARAVRTIIADERRARAEVAAEIADGDAAVAASLDRSTTLTRLDALARVARRDPLGIGVPTGYIAAVEAGAIRLRAILTGIAAGWSREAIGSFLATGPVGGG